MAGSVSFSTSVAGVMEFGAELVLKCASTSPVAFVMKRKSATSSPSAKAQLHAVLLASSLTRPTAPSKNPPLLRASSMILLSAMYRLGYSGRHKLPMRFMMDMTA